jgi:hypothetical protein
MERANPCKPLKLENAAIDPQAGVFHASNHYRV